MIQRKEAVKAKKMPRASTLNSTFKPGRTVNREYTIAFPSRIVGSIDATKENLATAAAMVQNSLNSTFAVVRASP
jgi:hypothetical protein